MHDSRNTPPGAASSPVDLDAWFTTALGQRVLAVEQGFVNDILPRRFGYHLLQLGQAATPLFSDSPIGHRFALTTRNYPGFSGALAEPDALPLVTESTDLVLLHHVLEFSARPHQVLREVSRVLIAGGHLLILAFNPFSAWGLRAAMSRRRETPWQARMISPKRLCDWLLLLDFQVEQLQFGMHCWPVNSPRWIRWSSCLEPLSSRLNCPTGGLVMISARKQVAPLTPIQTRWRFPVSPVLPMPEKASHRER